MATLEAISKVALLLADLLRRARDKETFGLVEQIKTYQTIIEKESKEKDAEIERMKDRIKELETKLKTPKQEMFIPRMFGKSTYY